MRRRLLVLLLIVAMVPGVALCSPEVNGNRSTGNGFTNAVYHNRSTEVFIGGVVGVGLIVLALADYIDLYVESNMNSEKGKIINELLWRSWPGVLKNDEGWDYIKGQLDRGNYRLVLQTAAAYGLPALIALDAFMVLCVKGWKATFGGKKEEKMKKREKNK